MTATQRLGLALMLLVLFCMIAVLIVSAILNTPPVPSVGGSFVLVVLFVAGCILYLAD